MRHLRNQSHQSSSSLFLSTNHKIVSELPETIEELFPKSSDDGDSKRHFGIISFALILLGNGYTDECHDLITPLSWGSGTHFGGPTMLSNVSPTAQTYATYVHCLVHRKEGSHVGEFGMTGWSNANYWSSAVDSSSRFQELPHQDWIEQIRNLIQRYKSNELVQEWAKQNRFVDNNDDVRIYDSRIGHKLCSRVMANNGAKGDAAVFQDFAEKVAESEVRVLLAHSLQRAGFDDAFETVMKVNTNVEAQRSENEL